MSQIKLLITGFDPFGGETVNPAWEAVKGLPDQIGAVQLHKLEIPTVFGLAARKVLQAAEQIHPDVIVCVGQAGGHSAITPERIAINVRDARIADNQGNQPRGEQVDPEGPAAYFATVDVIAMADSIEKAGIPATVSNSAGAFVCNDTLYTLLHHFARTETKVGFVHVPFLPEQAKDHIPSMELAQITAGLAAAISSLAK